MACASRRVTRVLVFLISTCAWSQALAAPPVPPKMFPPNRLYVTSFGTNEVKSFLADGTFDTSFDGAGLIAGPEALAFGPDGLLYVTCSPTNAVRAIDADDALHGFYNGGGLLSAPNGITFGPFGELVVASRGDDRVYFLDSNDTMTFQFGNGTTLDSPRHLAFAPDGVLHVSSYGTDNVFRIGIGGGSLAPMNPNQLTGPIGLAFSPSGRILVSSSVTDDFVSMSKDETDLWFSDATLETPYGIVVGPDHRIYVAADASSSVIRFAGGAADQEIGWFDGLSGMGGLAFSPHYFSVRLKGKVFDNDGSNVKRSGKAMLGYAPGSGRVTLSFTDDANDPNDLATLFEKPVVLHGQEGGEGNTRTFVGSEIPGDDKHYRTTVVDLKIVGSVNDDGFFVVKEITGSLARTGMNDGGEVYRAKIETLKRLN